MTAEDHPAPPPLVQVAVGSNIAQAAHGGTATVNVYQYVAARPIGTAELDAGAELLAGLPADGLPAIASLPGGSRLPLRPNPLFTGRSAELRRLADRITAPDATVAITGLGGVGKTQLAVEFVHRFGQYFAGGVQWLSLADPGTVPVEVAGCADALALRPDLHTLPLAQRVEEVLAVWQQPLPRLLVFDNCEDEDLLATWRPTTGGARVIVTSRRHDWDPALGVDGLPLDVLAETDGVELIRRFRPDLAPDDPDLAGITGALGGLPLALHMAGNYLRTFRRVELGEPAAYRSLLAGSPVLAHPSMTGDTERFSPTGHERHVANTFAIGYQRLAGDADAVGRRILVACAAMAPGEPVPRDLIHHAAGADAGPVELAIGRLEALGLIGQGAAGELRMHRLVAAYVDAEADDPAARLDAENALFDIAQKACEATDAHALARVEQHVRRVTERALPARDLTAAGWANLIGTMLNALGDYAGAFPYLQESLSIAEEVYGPDDPRIGKAVNDLGHSLMLMSQEAAAVPYFERAIALWQRAGDVPNLAATLDNLGQARIALKADAGPALEQALALRTAHFGADHPRTATTLHSLGRFHYAEGRYGEAERYFREALRSREARRVPAAVATTLTALGTLALTQARFAEAEPLLERALAIRQAELGGAHTRTKATLSALIQLHLAVGDTAAVARYREMLGETSRRAGTADDLNTAGYVAWAAGDFQTALQWYERALAVGASPSLVLNNSGMARLGLQEYATAVDLFGRSLAELEAGTPLHARVRNNLGVALTGLGRLDDAEAELAVALEERRRLHGDVHPDVATTIDNLGLLRLARGDLAGAAELLHRAYEMRRPADLPAEIAKSRHHLGLLAAAGGDRETARQLFASALALRQKHLPQHPDTAATLVELNRLGEALEIYQLRFGPDHPRTRATREALEAGPA